MQEIAQARLVWEKEDGSQVEYALGALPMLVGRDDTADIRVDEPLVSRTHARIECRGSYFVLIDLGSTNLPRVNGLVIAEHQLTDGDEVRFARARCRFVTRRPK